MNNFRDAIYSLISAAGRPATRAIAVFVLVLGLVLVLPGSSGGLAI